MSILEPILIVLAAIGLLTLFMWLDMQSPQRGYLGGGKPIMQRPKVPAGPASGAREAVIGDRVDLGRRRG